MGNCLSCSSAKAAYWRAKRQGTETLKTEKLDTYWDWNKYTVLHYACQYNDVEMVEFLIDHGADKHAKTSTIATGATGSQFEKWEPIHIAAYFAATDVIKALLKRGVKIDIKGPDHPFGCNIAHCVVLGALDQSRSNVKITVEQRMECATFIYNERPNLFINDSIRFDVESNHGCNGSALSVASICKSFKTFCIFPKYPLLHGEFGALLATWSQKHTEDCVAWGKQRAIEKEKKYQEEQAKILKQHANYVTNRVMNTLTRLHHISFEEIMEQRLREQLFKELNEIELAKGIDDKTQHLNQLAEYLSNEIILAMDDQQRIANRSITNFTTAWLKNKKKATEEARNRVRMVENPVRKDGTSVRKEVNKTIGEEVGNQIGGFIADQIGGPFGSIVGSGVGAGTSKTVEMTLNDATKPRNTK